MFTKGSLQLQLVPRQEVVANISLTIIVYYDRYFKLLAALFFSSYESSKKILRTYNQYQLPAPLIHMIAAAIGEMVFLSTRTFEIFFIIFHLVYACIGCLYGSRSY